MNYNERVYEKMSAEFKTFMESLKALPGDKAIEKHAYEKVLKEDILSFFIDDDIKLSPKEAKALLSEKYPLDSLYREWLGSDYSYMDVLKDCVSDSIKDITKDWQKERNDAR